MWKIISIVCAAISALSVVFAPSIIQLICNPTLYGGVTMVVLIASLVGTFMSFLKLMDKITNSNKTSISEVKEEIKHLYADHSCVYSFDDSTKVLSELTDLLENKENKISRINIICFGVGEFGTLIKDIIRGKYGDIRLDVVVWSPPENAVNNKQESAPDEISKLIEKADNARTNRNSNINHDANNYRENPNVHIYRSRALPTIRACSVYSHTPEGACLTYSRTADNKKDKVIWSSLQSYFNDPCNKKDQGTIFYEHSIVIISEECNPTTDRIAQTIETEIDRLKNDYEEECISTIDWVGEIVETELKRLKKDFSIPEHAKKIEKITQTINGGIEQLKTILRGEDVK